MQDQNKDNVEPRNRGARNGRPPLLLAKRKVDEALVCLTDYEDLLQELVAVREAIIDRFSAEMKKPVEATFEARRRAL